MIVEYRAQLAALAAAVLAGEYPGRGYDYPPDVSVAPAVYVDTVAVAAAAAGLVTLTASVQLVTDAADHDAGRWLDQTGELLWLACLTAGLRPTALDPRVLQVDTDDDRDRRAGRVLTVTTTARPCP